MNTRRLRVAIAAVVLVVGGVEIGLRVLAGAGNPLLLQADPDIGYLFQPDQTLAILGNRIHINRFHQRAADIETVAEPGVLRVLLIGDSVAFGGVYVDQAETIGAHLESTLSAVGGVEVVTAAAGSWGIGNALAYLRRFGVLGSAVVVWQIGSHDLAQGKSDGAAVGRHPSMPDRKPLTAIGETCRRVIWPRYLRPRLGWVLGDTQDAAPRPDGAAQASAAANLRWLEEGIALIRAHGAMPAILHTPDRFEATGDPPAPAKEAVYRQQRGRFLALATQLEVPVVNLAERWRDAPQAREWFRDGVHLSAEGNAAAAQALGQLLRCDGISAVGDYP